jgi:hypothetical protein
MKEIWLYMPNKTACQKGWVYSVETTALKKQQRKKMIFTIKQIIFQTFLVSIGEFLEVYEKKEKSWKSIFEQ